MSKTGPASLASLIAAARAADGMDRMSFRDPIAEFGVEAVEGVTPWLTDPKLGGFAVRTIAAAAAHGARTEGVAALRAAHGSVPPAVRSDIEGALEAFGLRATPPKPDPKKDPVPLDRNLYRSLVAAARAKKVLTYTEAGEPLGLTMRNPHHRRLLGQHLGVISEFEHDQGRPMLSALVVQKGSGQPRTGSGFDQLGEELGLKRAVDDGATFEGRQLDRVYEFWASPAADALYDKIQASASDEA